MDGHEREGLAEVIVELTEYFVARVLTDGTHGVIRFRPESV